MAYTQADLTALRAQMVTGVLEFRFEDGRSTRFQSLNDMMALERVIESHLKMAAAAASGLSRRRFAAYSKGT